MLVTIVYASFCESYHLLIQYMVHLPHWWTDAQVLVDNEFNFLVFPKCLKAMFDISFEKPKLLSIAKKRF